MYICMTLNHVIIVIMQVYSMMQLYIWIYRIKQIIGEEETLVLAIFKRIKIPIFNPPIIFWLHRYMYAYMWYSLILNPPERIFHYFAKYYSRQYFISYGTCTCSYVRTYSHVHIILMYICVIILCVRMLGYYHA